MDKEVQISFAKVEMSFADSKIPVFQKMKYQNYISFGDDNKYPDYLLYLYNKSAKHNAIINGKVKYIFGGGWTLSDENDQKAKDWAAKLNPTESLTDISKKSVLDIELFGGFYWQVIPKMGGGQDIYHLPFSKVRASKDRKTFYFKHNWEDRKEEVTEFPAFHVGIGKSSVYFFGEYRPNTEPYCLPGYVGSINYIESDIEVSKHTLTSAKKGWRPSKVINFMNGVPNDDGKKEIAKQLKAAAEGSEGETFMITYNSDPAKKPIIDDLGVSELSKENFSNIDNLISSNIYAGHEITSPILFGIKEAGQLGGTTELRNAYDIFKNTYASHKQQQFEKIVNQFAGSAGVQASFKLNHLEPVGIEFDSSTIAEHAPQEWLYEKLGIDTKKYPVSSPSAPAGESQMVNEHLKNLTGRQHQALERILRKYDSGKLTRERATMLLKSSVGLTDDQVIKLLGENKFSAVSEDDVAEMFSKVGQSRNEFDIIETKEVDFISKEAEEKLFQSFAEEVDEKRKDVVIKNLPKISVKYSYEKRPSVSGPAIIPTTRPFCKKLIELDRFYTRKEIESISERLGYSVWDRRGGFWGDKPYCRHVWKSNIVIKK